MSWDIEITTGVRFCDTPIYDYEPLTEHEILPFSYTTGSIHIVGNGGWYFLWENEDGQKLRTYSVTDESLALPMLITDEVS